MVEVYLEDLKKVLLSFSETLCDSFSENSIVALEHKNHESGCIILVSGDVQESIKLSWNKKFSKAGYKERKKFVEAGAIALSIFMTRMFTDYTVVEEAIQSTGIDYWLGYDVNHALHDPKNFMLARLEVSGIEEESESNTIEKRVAIKKRQTSVSDVSGIPAYISIVEFKTPKAFFIRK